MRWEWGSDPDPSWPIGVFDSGLGGLTVWRALRRRLPQERLVYFADTARLPYGDRSAEEILTFVRQILRWMQAQPVKVVVMACNTSSALALEQVQQEFALPILGLILPGAQAALAQGSRIGVIATAATVKSRAYSKAIQEYSALDPRRFPQPVQCWEQACPEFVPLIEAGQLDGPELRQAAERYLQPLLQQGIDTLVYGCTHYPLLDPLLKSLLPSSVRRVDPGVALVGSLARELSLWGLRRPSTASQAEPHRFYVSGDPERFAQLATPWLGFRPQVERVEWPALDVNNSRRP
ncbi:glutamate racemase [Thermostichus sp. MS-CIW-21]|jgi:glutamate racemase|uniref:glutamate racemase n=1 Tax=unclassified Synechococcus TaxID=2626047 RepID=UPI00006946C6|nr:MULTISPECIES: glutamate racemase [unclassified Synechococcus]ABD00320.1 glutamate racemase [Synechococcus sp. JA-3-3Ab]PIK86820.1 glutamate racemase [Synechococcus sp. 63AY4M2]PIK92176.1 glutamate racemase [Synechococcus sp. 65AY6Li]PIK95889.1 glutamate racemase [Synechococcus sp. 60AY4M2]PIK98128.1 glutamate racemase [Synechococcus sp. 63AY4M1]